MADGIIPLRRCTSCGEQLPQTREFFLPHARRGGIGWRQRCKPCLAAIRKAHFKQLAATQKCKVLGCEKGAFTIASGLCCGHRSRLMKYGDVAAPRPIRVYYGVGYVNKYGYRMISTKRAHGRFAVRPEHRIVMERHLGRALRRNENVHHVNGNKADNRIENLELWTRAQPTGARVLDLIEYARSILLTYEPELDKLR